MDFKRDLVCICVCLCMCVSVFMSHEGRYTWRLEEGIKSTETEDIDSCELSHFSAGHQTLVF